jgi:hypothetical protein
MRDHGQLIAIVGLVAAVICACVLGSFSRVGAPLPISGMLLALMLLGLPLVGVPVMLVLIAWCYFGWLRPVWRLRAAFTWRTWAGVAVLAALSVIWYWRGWPYGMKYQGHVYTLGCACVSAAMVAVVTACGWFSRVLADSGLATAGRWVALLWVITYGFPWLGEFP